MRPGRCWATGAAAAVLLAVSACTANAMHPRPATVSSATAPPSATPGPGGLTGPSPIAEASLARLASITVGTTISPVTSPQAMRAAVPHLARSEAAAVHAALAYDRPGSRSMGITLARVTMYGPGFNHRPRLVWLVSVDPYGGAFIQGLPACGSYDYIIDFIDPSTAKVLVATADSHARGLRPLPVIGPAPHTASSARCQGSLGLAREVSGRRRGGRGPRPRR
jgi:hypothetical protein